MMEVAKLIELEDGWVGIMSESCDKGFRMKSAWVEEPTEPHVPKPIYRNILRNNKNSWKGKDKTRKNFTGGRALNRMK